ncbi:hypothetical protein E3T25_08935 [Cryobacterium sandaracinum]|uniref:Type I restriction modification DNA specificity domain-containing protein n=1 Tax=Cryobacterium sandaracinum TaxID=1259247 RepID=A0ABY2JDL9_9MICO|nr:MULTISPECIES: restriction endonuclease subunit S [Cryobacterium]TFC65942.1 hypothetical protein E3O54_11675 [Cryobacterium sp. TMT2-4]TFD02433.1 hypothetical protein E3T25_08935 [Cryobacterium sandaracinum]
MLSSASKTGGRDATGAVVPGRFALSIGRTALPEPSGFIWRALSDLARLESGHTPSRSRSDYWEGGIPWIGIRDATAHHGEIISDTNQHVSELGLLNSSARLLPAGTVCLSRTASVGYVVIMGVPMATSQDFVNWVCGPGLSPSYLRYLLMAEQESVRRFSYGTTHQTMYYPDAKALQVLVPTRSVQDATAEVLGALDDKIAANTKLVALLGETLAASFTAIVRESEGFIPFSELATVTKGVSYRSVDLVESRTALVTLKSFDRNGGYSARGLKDYAGPYKPEQRIYPGEIVVAQTDLTQAAEVVGRAIRVPGSGNHETLVASLDLAIVRPVSGVPVEFMLGLMLQGGFRAHCKSRTSGTTVLHLASDAIPTFRAPRVSVDVQQRYAAVALPMLEMRDSLRSESESLAATRNALLPALMSGKLRVRDAEKVLEGVL